MLMHFFPQISMVVCVFVLLFICTIMIKCYSHYTIFIYSNVEREREVEGGL